MSRLCINPILSLGILLIVDLETFKTSTPTNLLGNIEKDVIMYLKILCVNRDIAKEN